MYPSSDVQRYQQATSCNCCLCRGFWARSGLKFGMLDTCMTCLCASLAVGNTNCLCTDPNCQDLAVCQKDMSIFILRSAEPTYSPAAQVCNTYLSWFTSNVVALHAGQVMLVWPHQMYLTGITAGVILMVASGWFNIWSMWILVIFYMERKNKMVRTRCARACMSIPSRYSCNIAAQ